MLNNLNLQVLTDDQKLKLKGGNDDDAPDTIIVEDYDGL